MSKYNKENPLRVFEAFAGYGSQHMAFERIKRQIPGFDFKVVGISEIDKYVIQAYEAVHGECLRLMDVDEHNIDKMMNAGISDSQLYKMAGNSIVVACMEGIFKNLFSDSKEEYQSTLF